MTTAADGDEELKLIVQKDNTDRLRAEMKLAQTAFANDVVDQMARCDLIKHITDLRRLAGQTTAVRGLVSGFTPTPLTTSMGNVGVGRDGTSALAGVPTTPDVMSMMAMFMQSMATMQDKRDAAAAMERKEASALQQRRDDAAAEAAAKAAAGAAQERRDLLALQEKRDLETAAAIERAAEERRLAAEERRLAALEAKRRAELEDETRRIDADNAQRRHQETLDAQRELHRSEAERADRRERQSREDNKKMDIRLKRANDVMRGVLYHMNTLDAAEIPVYFESIERLFEMNKIDEDLRVSLITPFLDDKSRRLMSNLALTDIDSFDHLKRAILRENRLTPIVYRSNFNRACKSKEESHVQFSTRLHCLLKHYVHSRDIGGSYDKLMQLLVTDRLKDTLANGTRTYIVTREGKEWFEAERVAELADIFEGEQNFTSSRGHSKPFHDGSLSSQPFSKTADGAQAKGEASSRSISSGEARFDLRPRDKSRMRCYACNLVGHLASECRSSKSRGQPNVRVPTSSGGAEPNLSAGPRLCYKCHSPNHLSRECPEKVNRAFKGRIHRVAILPQSDLTEESEVGPLVHLTDPCVSLKTLVVDRVQLPGWSPPLISKSQVVTVDFGNGVVDCVVDSGAEISVLKPSMIPLKVMEDAGSIELVLQGAFGDATSARIVNVPACLVGTLTIGTGSIPALLCCAVSPKLVGEKALITSADYDALLRASECFLPEVEFLANTSLRFRDPMVTHAANSCRLEALAVHSVDQKAVGRGEKIKPDTPVRLGADLARLCPIAEYRSLQLDDLSLKSCWDIADQPGSPFIRRLDNQLLYRNQTIGGFQIAQLVLPTGKRRQVMTCAHDSDWAGHFGFQKTIQRIEAHFYWPTMKADIQLYVQSCVACQQRKRITKLDRVPIAPVVRAATSFEMVNIDVIGPFVPKSSRGHQYILCLIDSCTRWVEAVPLRTLTARETCDALLTIFSHIGIPRVLISDNGTNMVAGLTQEVYERLGIELRCATPYHPEGNSLVERWNQNLKHMLHHVLTSEEPRGWDRRLPYLLWAYRELPNATTGLSPYQLVYGRVGRGPLSVLKDTWSDDQADSPVLSGTSYEYLEKLKADLQVGVELAEQNAGKAQRSYVHQYNLRARDKEFEVGDMVLVLMPDSTNKVVARWQGPGTVTAKLSPYSYRISLDTGAVRTLHANDLRRFIPRVNSVGVIFEDDTDFGQIEYCPTAGMGATDDAISALELSHLSSIEQAELRGLLMKHRQVFKDKPGHCKVACHEINLVEGFKAKSLRPYRIPDKLRAEVDLQVSQLLADGRIRKSNSPYAHPIVCVSKPDKSVRLCCDFRHINSGTINDAYPMPRTEDLVNRISSARYISSLDCTAGYWQIPMRPADIPKTAFITHHGLYEWLVMPFGLKTASNSFQRVMDELLREHSDYAGAYIDDTAVFSNTWSDQIRHLDKVLTAIAAVGLTLRLAKCNFGRARVKFIGHFIGSGTKTVVQDKVEAIRAIPEPHTKKLLRSFLGMCGFYRMYIPNFSEVARPLTEMTKNRQANHLKFNETQRAAFLSLKTLLCESTVLYSPRSDQPYIIRTDASDYAIGAALAQVDDAGHERPVAFASAKLSDVQTRWSTIEKEAYAVIFALRKFDVNVFGCKIDLYTDHNPLQYLVTCAPNSAKLTRWALSLSRYDITVRHISGRENVTADCLSRC